MKYLNLQRRSPGFTFIELLVTIVIIMVLATAGFVSYSRAQVKARDTKRIADMKAIQATFEQYFTQNSNYATNCATMASAMTFTLPTAASASFPYVGTCSSVNSYCYCAQLENTGQGNATTNNCAMGSLGDYYCVQSQQ